MVNLLLDSVHVIDIVPSREEIEDRRTPDAIDLSQIQVITDLPDDLGLAQHMTIMLVVLQAVNVCLYFHDLPPPHIILGKAGQVAAQ